MPTSTTRAVLPRIESRIVVLRGLRLMIDADLAALYGVTTKRLNEQVKRNADRFPGDFMFKLTPVEKAEVVANCDHLAKLKFSKALPYAFTEHGATKAAARRPRGHKARSDPDAATSVLIRRLDVSLLVPR